MTITQQAPKAPMRFPRLAQPFIALGLAVMAEIGIAFFVLNVVAVPLIAVWVGIPLLLVFVPCVRWYANCHRVLYGGLIGTVIPQAVQEAADARPADVAADHAVRPGDLA